MSNIIEVQCQDTTESRILFGFMRKVYNAEVKKSKSTVYINQLPESLFFEARQSGQLERNTSIDYNREALLSKKKNGSLTTIKKFKTSVKIEDGVITFIKDAKLIKNTLLLMPDSKLLNGVYSKAFISWNKNTPILEVDRTSKRGLENPLSEKRFNEILSVKVKSKIDFVYSKNKADKLKFMQNTKGRDLSSPETKKIIVNLQRIIDTKHQEECSKAKKIILLYLKNIDAKYYNKTLNNFKKKNLSLGENQAHIDYSEVLYTKIPELQSVLQLNNSELDIFREILTAH